MTRRLDDLVAALTVQFPSYLPLDNTRAKNMSVQHRSRPLNGHRGEGGRTIVVPPLAPSQCIHGPGCHGSTEINFKGYRDDVTIRFFKNPAFTTTK